MTDREILQALYSDMQTVKQDTKELKQDVATLKQDVTILKEDTQELKLKVSRSDGKTLKLEKDIEYIKFILENEVKVSIMRVAEGHLDLSRNLKKILKPNSELEMLTVKVNLLESDVKELKKHRIS